MSWEGMTLLHLERRRVFRLSYLDNRRLFSLISVWVITWQKWHRSQSTGVLWFIVTASRSCGSTSRWQYSPVAVVVCVCTVKSPVALHFSNQLLLCTWNVNCIDIFNWITEICFGLLHHLLTFHMFGGFSFLSLLYLTVINTIQRRKSGWMFSSIFLCCFSLPASSLKWSHCMWCGSGWMGQHRDHFLHNEDFYFDILGQKFYWIFTKVRFPVSYWHLKA